MDQTPINVAINAQIDPLEAGGIQTSCNSLIRGLQNASARIKLKVLTQPQWVSSYSGICGSECTVHPIDMAEIAPITKAPPARLRNIYPKLPQPGRQLVDQLTRIHRDRVMEKRSLAGSENTQYLQSLGIDVLHFCYPRMFAHSLPYIFEPHDLQHEVMPEYFSEEELGWRKIHYRHGCQNARFVVCGSVFTKQDIIKFYEVDPQRIAVIPRTTLDDTAPQRTDAPSIALPQRFALYPASTYPHKNHQRLIQAVEIMAQQPGVIPILCTGIKTEHFPQLEQALRERNLSDLVRFTGPLSDAEIRWAYRQAEFVVFPSLYEGSSQALLEALANKKYVVAAHQTSNPETLGAAADYFDGLSVDDMASTILRAMQQTRGPVQIVQRAEEQLMHFDWDKATTAFSALYKAAADHPLSDEENNALNAAVSQ
ncbi:MAG: glycosyltransferase family 1 protein [Pseudomonadota bacterium]